MKNVGEPCAGEPHARFEVAAGGDQRQSGQHAPCGRGNLPPTLLHHRWVRANHAKHVQFLARWPSRQGMQHARDEIREITDRRWLLRPVDETVGKVNTFLHGWVAYFRYGNSARHFDVISNYAANRVALQVAKRHKRTRGYGWSVLAFQSPDRLGLIDLNGTIVAPRPHRSWRG